MRRIQSPYAIQERFIQGDLENPKTPMTASWLNDVQEELCHVIESENLSLSQQDSSQLLKAILKKVNLKNQNHNRSFRSINFRSWILPKRFPSQNPSNFSLDSQYAYQGFLSQCRESCRPQALSLPFDAVALQNLRLNASEVMGAYFTALIERKTNQSNFSAVLTRTAQFFLGRSETTPVTYKPQWTFLKSLDGKFLQSEKNKFRRYSESEYARIHSEPLHPTRAFHPLAATLLIHPEGQIYCAGVTEDFSDSELESYSGRVTLFEFKSILPIP